MPAFETLELDCDRFGHAAGSFVFEEVVHPRGGKQAADCTDATRQQTLKDLQKRAWDLGNPFLPTFVGPTNTAHWR